jgi:hypothetical protein
VCARANARVRELHREAADTIFYERSSRRSRFAPGAKTSARARAAAWLDGGRAVGIGRREGLADERPSAVRLLSDPRTEKKRRLETMKSIKIAGLCLVAVLAFSALAAASASAAEPTFKVCAKAAKEPKGSAHKYSGSFKDKGCTEAEAGGKYELNEIPKLTPYTGASKTTRIRFKNKEGKTVTVTCKKDALAILTSSRHERGSTGFSGTLTFESCTNESGKACTVTASTFSNELMGFTVGEEAPYGTVSYDEFFIECGSEETILGGWLAGTDETTTKGITIAYNLTGEGKQEDRSFYFQGEPFSATGENPYLQRFNEATEEFEEGEATFEGKEEFKAKGLSVQ